MYPTPTPSPSPKPSEPCSSRDRRGQVLAGRIRLDSVLGVGAYGTVYCAEDTKTHRQYAVKALDKADLDARQQSFQEREIRLHHLASLHKNVVSMEKILDTPDCTFVVLEYCPEGDLFTRITDFGDYVGKDEKAREVFLQILDAVRHCHLNGIYHRDLKPENILVQEDGMTVKLADFGLATQDRITSDFGCGSTFYMSPECQQSNPNPNASYASVPNDVWSLGVILVNLTCGRNPWKRACMEDSTFRAFSRDRTFLKSILPISDDLNDILCRIFEVRPERRISLNALRKRIAACRQLGQTPMDAIMDNGMLTPPDSPVEKPIDPAMASPNGPMEPTMPMEFEPLPAQQYPPFPSMPFGHDVVQPPFAPVGFSYPSPSPSPSPHGQYTYPANMPPSSPAAYRSPGGFIPSFSPWARCNNLMPNFAHQSCIRNMPPVF